MAKDLTSFPSAAMVGPDEEWDAVVRAARVPKAFRCEQELRVLHFDPQS